MVNKSVQPKPTFRKFVNMRKVGFFVFILCVFVGCNEGVEDVVSPVIEVFQIPSAGLAPGDEFSIDVTVSDNVELSQLRIRVREAFAKSFAHWSLVRVYDLSGANHNQMYTFEIPDSSLAGLYEVGIQVVDTEGNSTIDSLQTFFIGQPGLQPVFIDFSTVPIANEAGNITLFLNDTLTFSGLIEDPVGLDRINIELKGPTGNNLSNKTYPVSDTLVVFSWNALLEADFLTFSNFSVVPTSLTVKALNLEGHQSRRQFNLVFLE
jgi:hypothetical protein